MRSVASKDPAKPKSKPRSQESQSEAVPFMPAKDHHHIGESQRSHCDILAWVYEHEDSPCVKVRI
jgi:hypothetical protein